MLCDGILGGWGTKLAAAQGVDVTADEVYAWFMGHPEWYGPKDPVVARIEADKSGETIDWLKNWACRSRAKWPLASATPSCPSSIKWRAKAPR